MITDFTTLVGKGLQHITIGGVDSLADLGVLIAVETKTGDIAAKSALEDMPLMDGGLDNSIVNGRLYYEPRELSYRFKVIASTDAELSAKVKDLKAWLDGAGKCTIADSKYLITENSITTQWVFVNCVLKNIEQEEGEKGLEAVYCYVTAQFLASPRMQKAGEVNSRILKVTSYGNVSINLTDNSAYSVVVAGEISSGTYTATAPYKYRIEAYGAGAATITVNGTALADDGFFELENATDDATIAITHSGFGYYEIWHDTRGVSVI